jgi:hypothetical protein
MEDKLFKQRAEELHLCAKEQGYLKYDGDCHCNICRLLYRHIKLPTIHLRLIEILEGVNK